MAPVERVSEDVQGWSEQVMVPDKHVIQIIPLTLRFLTEALFESQNVVLQRPCNVVRVAEVK